MVRGLLLTTFVLLQSGLTFASGNSKPLNFECSSSLSEGTVTLKVRGDFADLDIHTNHPLLRGETLNGHYEKLENFWDGHISGIMTASGISITYEDHYSCIRNVKVTAFVRNPAIGTGWISNYSFDSCKGYGEFCH